MMLAWLVFPALAADPTPLDTGRSTYTAKCQSCHGPRGQGDGPAARALARRPADLSDPAFWSRVDEAVLRSVITSGRPGTAMRGFPMADERLDALVLYLRSFAVKPAEPPSP